MDTLEALEALGHAQRVFTRLETIDCPGEVKLVTFETSEVTALCPVTGQPDWYTVHVEFTPKHRSLESKSFKLFVQSFRDRGIFCEDLAAEILRALVDTLIPVACYVRVEQRARGGVSLHAEAQFR